jgi:hypothetical protein
MKAALSVLILLLSAVPALAQERWAGFKPVDELNVPFKDYLVNSIVLIATVGIVDDLKDKGFEIVDVTKVKAVTKKAKLAPGDDPTKVQPNLRAIQIETCRKQGLRFCPVIKVSSMSTGFFEDGVRLNTCRHVFHNWLVWASQANDNMPVEDLSPPMILYGKDHKILYNSATAKPADLLKFSFLNTDPRINVPDFGKPNPPSAAWSNYRASDVAQLTAKAPLVTPQSVSYDLDMLHYSTYTNVYLVGYPGKTRYFSDGNGDAPGGQLVASVGRLLVASPTQEAVQTSNLSKTGMSGSPLIASDGRIMGMECAGERPAAIDQPETAKSLAFVFDQPGLKAVWSKLPF